MQFSWARRPERTCRERWLTPPPPPPGGAHAPPHSPLCLLQCACDRINVLLLSANRLFKTSDFKWYFLPPLLLSANRQPRPAYRVLVRPLALVWTRHRQPSTSTDRATGPISKRVTPHLLTASYIYFLLYCRLLSTPTQVPIATGKQYRVLVRPLDTARQAGMPEAAAAARWPAACCHLLECSGQEGLAAVRNGPGTPGRPRPPTEQDSDASAPGAGAEPCGAPVPRPRLETGKRRFGYRAAALLNRVPADAIEQRPARFARAAKAALLSG